MPRPRVSTLLEPDGNTVYDSCIIVEYLHLLNAPQLLGRGGDVLTGNRDRRCCLCLITCVSRDHHIQRYDNGSLARPRNCLGCFHKFLESGIRYGFIFWSGRLLCP
jgi:hypothetical protein